ncbi:hypothetical protein HETIRDRAFT_441654 [Heterobasidion irregulare TC 32-1]|uniref:Uncharacterized protein n=1 Tax=Heterobasidion irregulare (strain TC 32-1) TaxID=747525 RepID=W4JVV1_HETIT|nr:uncharacterized protein HETIRDRAFT_441654 [Heterobasidion irregulare TC 32-1]ETW76996.1 hypothetical protein HETIRDRAFT_441654 [Heterobasidion irregulare TC 32-1]
MRQREAGLDCAVLSTMETHLNETGSSLPDIDTWLKLHCRITTLAPTTHVDCPERLMTLETAMRERGSSARDRIEALKEAERLTSLGFGVSSRLKVLNELVRQCRTIGTEDASQEALPSSRVKNNHTHLTTLMISPTPLVSTPHPSPSMLPPSRCDTPSHSFSG